MMKTRSNRPLRKVGVSTIDTAQPEKAARTDYPTRKFGRKLSRVQKENIEIQSDENDKENQNQRQNQIRNQNQLKKQTKTLKTKPLPVKSAQKRDRSDSLSEREDDFDSANEDKNLEKEFESLYDSIKTSTLKTSSSLDETLSSPPLSPSTSLRDTSSFHSSLLDTASDKKSTQYLQKKANLLFNDLNNQINSHMLDYSAEIKEFYNQNFLKLSHNFHQYAQHETEINHKKVKNWLGQAKKESSPDTEFFLQSIESIDQQMKSLSRMKATDNKLLLNLIGTERELMDSEVRLSSERN